MVSGRGRHQSSTERLLLAESSGYCCVYCELPFGCSVQLGEGSERLTEMHVDHIVPLSWFGQETTQAEVVAACSVCNGLKGSQIFVSLADAKRYLNRRWVEKRARVWFRPSRSYLEDDETWAQQYQEYLSARRNQLE